MFIEKLFMKLKLLLIFKVGEIIISTRTSGSSFSKIQRNRNNFTILKIVVRFKNKKFRIV